MKDSNVSGFPHHLDGSGRRRDNNVLKNVVSLRVSDEELAFLTRLRSATSKSLSEIMREALLSLPRPGSAMFRSLQKTG